MDDATRKNRANQRNPNHRPTGRGRPRGYHGAGTPQDLNNHANQRNPNNSRYGGSRGSRNNEEESTSDDGNAFGAVAAGVAIVAVATGGLYLLSKLFGGSENNEEPTAQAEQSPPRPENLGIMCIVCRKQTNGNNRIVLKCNHMLHHQCYRILSETDTCPDFGCRRPFQIVAAHLRMDDPAITNRGNLLNPNNAITGPGRPAGYHGAGTQDDLDNYANQLNPNNIITGPGRPAGYHGAGTQDDLDNHANQLNPNNFRYGGNRKNNGMLELQSRYDADADSDD